MATFGADAPSPARSTGTPALSSSSHDGGTHALTTPHLDSAHAVDIWLQGQASVPNAPDSPTSIIHLYPARPGVTSTHAYFRPLPPSSSVTAALAESLAAQIAARVRGDAQSCRESLRFFQKFAANYTKGFRHSAEDIVAAAHFARRLPIRANRGVAGGFSRLLSRPCGFLMAPEIRLLVVCLSLAQTGMGERVDRTRNVDIGRFMCISTRELLGLEIAALKVLQFDAVIGLEEWVDAVRAYGRHQSNLLPKGRETVSIAIKEMLLTAQEARVAAAEARLAYETFLAQHPAAAVSGDVRPKRASEDVQSSSGPEGFAHMSTTKLWNRVRSKLSPHRTPVKTPDRTPKPEQTGEPALDPGIVAKGLDKARSLAPKPLVLDPIPRMFDKETNLVPPSLSTPCHSPTSSPASPQVAANDFGKTASALRLIDGLLEPQPGPQWVLRRPGRAMEPCRVLVRA